ncbi:hypothetical protein GW17_00040325 [Ensete ventricosum]|nr:hypothetical protein GW17_00040325 [Ensete ventricosum]RZS06810.1 hypothetical protein BHM03_00037528 [Ensete ventricosum]
MYVEQRAGTAAMEVNALAEAHVIHASTTTQYATALSTTASACLVLKENRAELGLNVPTPGSFPLAMETGRGGYFLSANGLGKGGRQEVWGELLAVRRWSAIAASLPGRTDNEIKNVWHTHLKKRMDPKEATQASKKRRRRKKKKRDAKNESEPERVNPQADADPGNPRCDVIEVSVEESYSGFSSAATTDSSAVSGDVTSSNMEAREEESYDSKEVAVIDESFWLDEAFSIDISTESMTLAPLEVPTSAAGAAVGEESLSSFSSTTGDDMNFWLKVFMEAEHLEDLPRINPADVQLI